MSFDRGATEALYNRLHAQVADGEIDGETVLDALDQMLAAADRVDKLEALVRDLENECHRVGAI